MGRIRGTSTAGAKGPMQFLPSTWEAYGEGDIEDPDDAIMAAARYLANYGAPADMDRALFAYNHSDHYVRPSRSTRSSCARTLAATAHTTAGRCTTGRPRAAKRCSTRAGRQPRTRWFESRRPSFVETANDVRLCVR